MRTCPTCGTVYGDDLSYCLEDGVKLSAAPTSDLTNEPTQIYQPATVHSTGISTAETIATGQQVMPPAPTAFKVSAVEPKSRMGCVITIGSVACGLIVVGGLGFYSLFSSRLDLAKAPPLPTSVNTNASSSGSGNIKTAPVSTANSTSTPVRNANQVSSTISGRVLNDRALSLPQPVYPPAARAVRASGKVSVQVLVDQSGRVVSASSVSGHPLLRGAAETAARSATFEPMLISGQPVSFSGMLIYDFAEQDANAKKAQ